ncbi:hypothetical protein BDN72DRAFT_881881 [Pluteus cervinus]|uniref:Uncharacterized protein n=1 Tax=Pluteus cervinus TaxID=181527 RepID=A0ACD3ADR7_9AGAR|nr:hypothetical protein BDN72DRAFT_881881 [Pluteus cervinus]
MIAPGIEGSNPSQCLSKKCCTPFSRYSRRSVSNGILQSSGDPMNYQGRRCRSLPTIDWHEAIQSRYRSSHWLSVVPSLVVSLQTFCRRSKVVFHSLKQLKVLCMSEAIFPPEIEYIIFTDALVLNDGGRTAQQLILVAKRVHEWLIPRIMRTIAIRKILPTQEYPYDLPIQAFQKHGRHTRHLFIWIPTLQTHQATRERCLALCPSTTDLLIWGTTLLNQTTLDAVARLPLTHLSTDLGYFREMTPDLIRLFSRITHFDCLTTITSEAYETKIKYFTSLTHLAVPDRYDMSNIKTSLFEKMPTLQVLILLESGDAMGLSGVFNVNEDDPRVVRMTFEAKMEVRDWLLDVQEGRGMWGLADEAVKERRKLKEALKMVME